MSVFQSSVLFLSGLIFGSFLGAFSWRYPRKISVVKGRSFCPKCRRQINWFDNIPLLSFLILSGRCRSCHKKISWRYPLVELVTGVGFLLVGWNAYLLAIFTILFLIFIIDMEQQIIPDELIFLGVLLLAISGKQFADLLSGFLSASTLLLIHLITHGRGMGLGDVKFAVLGGLLVGLKLAPVWLFTAFLTGALVGIILILAGRVSLKSRIAFGPFLVAAVPISLVWGERILDLLLLN